MAKARKKTSKAKPKARRSYGAVAPKKTAKKVRKSPRRTFGALSSEAMADHLLSEALRRVQSDSIRKWATSARNFPLWQKIALDAVKKGGRLNDPDWFAGYIVASAMGM